MKKQDLNERLSLEEIQKISNMHKIQIEEEYNDDFYEDYMPRLKFEQNQEETYNEASSSSSEDNQNQNQNPPSQISETPRIFLKGVPQQHRKEDHHRENQKYNKEKYVKKGKEMRTDQSY